MSQTIFITGASSGLGKQAALLFARKGWKVIATMRNPAAETELTAEPNIRVLALDVTQAEQVKQTIAELLKSTSVDVVFNNAGYGLAGPFEGASEEQLQRQIDTNVMGVMRVTQAFIAHFRARGAGMFITTTSIGGHVAFPMNSVYHATKWALEGWSESLSFELAPFGITVKTVAPGGIRTDFTGRSLVLTTHDAYIPMMDKVRAAFTNPERMKRGSSAEQIAEVVYEAATDGKKQLRYIAGKDAQLMFRIRRWMGYEFVMDRVRKAFL